MSAPHGDTHGALRKPLTVETMPDHIERFRRDLDDIGDATMILRPIKYIVSIWRIGSAAIASHSLHWAGSVAGHVDFFAEGIVRGWVYDASRHAGPLWVDICLDGQPLARLKVNDYRADLAAALGDDGLHGFSGTYDLEASRRGSLLSVRLAGRLECVVGSVLVPISRTPEEIPPEKWSCLMFGLPEEDDRRRKTKAKIRRSAWKIGLFGSRPAE